MSVIAKIISCVLPLPFLLAAKLPVLAVCYWALVPGADVSPRTWDHCVPFFRGGAYTILATLATVAIAVMATRKTDAEEEVPCLSESESGEEYLPTDESD